MRKSWLSMRLLVLSLVGTVLIASVSLGVIFNYLFEHFSEETPMQSYAEQKALLATLAISLDTAIQDQRTFEKLRNEAPFLTITARTNFPLPALLNDQLDLGETLVLESAEQVSLHHLLPNRQEIISLNLEVNRVTENNGALRLIMTSLFYLCLISLLLIWVYPLLLRLLRLREAAQAFGKGNFSVRVEVGSGSYIADIEREFNNMSKRIEALIQDIKLLSSAASHDLRTPLARIRFGVETMAEEDHPTQREQYQKRIIRDVDSMVELVEQLLNYTRLEQQLLNSKFEVVNVDTMLEQLIAQIDDGTIAVNLDVPPSSVTLFAYDEFIQTLLNNLIGNAAKYAHKQIKITLTQQHRDVCVIVEDDGPGIAKDKWQEVLQPFIRGDNSSTSKGFGLGLAVVKRISEHFGGSITISDSEVLGGAKIQVTLKAK